MQTTTRLLISLCFLLCAIGCNGWKRQGHSLIASLAQLRLENNTQVYIEGILGKNVTLESIANWADLYKIRRGTKYRWTSKLHVSRQPSWQCCYTNRYCKRRLVHSITKFTKHLYRRKDMSRVKLAKKRIHLDFSLKMLVHNVGDVHQPLHLGFRRDRAATGLQVIYNNKSTNLHEVWDRWLLQTRIDEEFNADLNAYFQFLAGKTARYRIIKNWEQCPCNTVSCPVVYADESSKISCLNAYVHVNGSHIADGDVLSREYYTANIEIIEERIIKGGVRLASILNKIFATDAIRPTKGCKYYLSCQSLRKNDHTGDVHARLKLSNKKEKKKGTSTYGSNAWILVIVFGVILVVMIPIVYFLAKKCRNKNRDYKPINAIFSGPTDIKGGVLESS